MSSINDLLIKISTDQRLFKFAYVCKARYDLITHDEKRKFFIC